LGKKDLEVLQDLKGLLGHKVIKEILAFQE
jgi:hypothetical protein